MRIILLSGLVSLLVSCEYPRQVPLADSPQSIYARNIKSVWEVSDIYFEADGTKIKEGEIWYRKSGPILIAAPHEPSDRFTGDIVFEICRINPEFSCLVAKNFRSDRDGRLRYNVNRPTITNGSDSCDRPNRFAYRIFQNFREYLERSSVRLYVEIHGNSRPLSQNAIEIAHEGINAIRIEQAFSGLPVKIEGLSFIHYRAREAKACGTLDIMPSSIHLELPFDFRDPDKPIGKDIATRLNIAVTRLVAMEF